MTPRWIGGRTFDLAFFFGGAALAMALGALCIAAPGTVAPLWWLWLALVDGPHLLGTWARTYLDRDEWRKRRPLLLGSLLLLAPGPLCVLLAHTTGVRTPFEGFLAVAALWSWHHMVRQDFGIMAVYERLHGATPEARRIDGAFLHGALWAFYGLFLVSHPSNRLIIGLPPELPEVANAAASALSVALAAACPVYVGLLAMRHRAGRPVIPGLFVLLQVAASAVFGFFVVGHFEPLVPAPTDPEQHFLAVAVVIGTIHGLQYLGIVFAASRRRYAAAGPSLAARLGRAPLLAYGVFVLGSLGYLALNGARGNGPDVALLAPGSAGAELFLALYWGVFFHHYWLDQKIWHPGQDPALRVELGMAT